jgi:hypothetical protein
MQRGLASKDTAAGRVNRSLRPVCGSLTAARETVLYAFPPLFLHLQNTLHWNGRMNTHTEASGRGGVGRDRGSLTGRVLFFFFLFAVDPERGHGTPHYLLTHYTFSPSFPNATTSHTQVDPIGISPCSTAIQHPGLRISTCCRGLCPRASLLRVFLYWRWGFHVYTMDHSHRRTSMGSNANTLFTSIWNMAIVFGDPECSGRIKRYEVVLVCTCPPGEICAGMVLLQIP